MLKQDEFDIDSKFSNEMNFGFFVVDIMHLKKELVENSRILSSQISESN
jgi:hypothetical protein